MEIQDVQVAVTPILKKYGIKRASVFGSLSRGEDTPQSDIDILITIGKPMGLFTYIRMRDEMEQKLGKKVDVVSDKSINKFIKPHITKELRPIYEG